MQILTDEFGNVLKLYKDKFGNARLQIADNEFRVVDETQAVGIKTFISEFCNENVAENNGEAETEKPNEETLSKPT